MTTLRTLATVALPLAVAGSLAGVSPALASGGGGGDVVRASGSCSGATTWALKAKSDDGRIEVELEVDGRTGQTWAWRLTDGGVRVARGTATTAGPSGSFSVDRRIADRAGTDVIALRAVHGNEVCTGTVRLPQA